MAKEITKREFVKRFMELDLRRVNFRSKSANEDDESVKAHIVTIKEIEEYLSQRDDNWVELNFDLAIQKANGVYKYYAI